MVNKGTGYAAAFRTRGLTGFRLQTSGSGTATPFLLDKNATGKVTYFNADQSESIVLERFRDSEALIEHSANLAHLMEAILATGSVSGELLGEPSAELRAKLADSPVGLFTPYQLM